MKFYRYIVCAFLFIGAAIAETININWINEGETYAQTTCEIGGDIILPTTPTKRGHTFAGWQKEYTRLEYIESTGTQYIDTKIIRDFTDDIECVFSEYTRDTLFGTQNSDPQTVCLQTDGDLYTKNFSGGNATKNSVPAIHSKHTILFQINGKTFLDYALISNDAISGLNTTPVYIFSRASKQPGSARVHSFRIGSKFNGIPVKRISDGVVGMYDTVSQTFFTNAGAGKFISGPVAENQNFNE